MQQMPVGKAENTSVLAAFTPVGGESLKLSLIAKINARPVLPRYLLSADSGLT
jgi:hypothetical protein